MNKSILLSIVYIMLAHQPIYTCMQSKPYINLTSWHFFYRIAPPEINNYIKVFFRRLVSKDHSHLHPKKEYLASEQVSPQTLLQYSSTIGGKRLNMEIDGFHIVATIHDSYYLCIPNLKKEYMVQVYDKEGECIIEDRHPQQISFLNIENDTLTIYYNNSAWNHLRTNTSMITQSWDLSVFEKKDISDMNCLEYAVLYHCKHNNIAKKELKSTLVSYMYDKFSSRQYTLPSPHD